MFSVDTTKLNALERKVIDDLIAYSKTRPAPRILDAAKICACSASQVSKAIKKAGFSGYKDFMQCLYVGPQPKTAFRAQALDELERLKRVLEDFDMSTVDEFAELIESHEKITLFGYGPSLISAQYFEYKLRFCSNAFVTTAPDEQSAKSMLDRSSLLVIFSTTGQYRSFESLTLEAKKQEADVVVVSEEFNPLLMENCNRYFVLTSHKQSDSLKPYEKTRTVFFIFFEQVIQKILWDKAKE
ncbi:MAG TPA: RpiR family transcriptional regulator [Spirochaetaceae bacterium]|jgi:DNA-binding MurR/RpiR family transcriptional regulator|nr:RpiR family transcriptional regulator [Spirochaetaceae bacterium]